MIEQTVNFTLSELLTNQTDAPRPQSPSLDNMMNVEDENPEDNDGGQGQSDSLSLEKMSQLISGY